MAIIAPFRGLTYNYKEINDLEKIITPPYDVISEKEQEEYYNSHPNNIIRLELGKKKESDSDLENRYTRAADYLKKWESDAILTRSGEDTIYLTSHSYDPGDGNGTRIRWGFVALVKIEEEGSGVILPHERTFSAHKDDRLKLLKACSTQLSQVFGLYDDSGDRMLDELRKFSNTLPEISFTFKDGTEHKMWCITDIDAIKKVAISMKDKSIFIADGHHRYETSRDFRNFMRGKNGPGANKPYEYLMMYLTDMGEEGLTILPSHRLIKKVEGFELVSFLEKAGQYFEIEKMLPGESRAKEHLTELKSVLAEKGAENSAFIFHCSQDSGYYLMSLKPGTMDEMEKDLHPSLRKLDVIVLSRLIFQKSLGFTKADLDKDSIFQYNSNLLSALALVDSGECEITFLLNPTKIEQVQEIARGSLIMPRKSTYFYPKVLTGMVLNKIDPDDKIQIL